MKYKTTSFFGWICDGRKLPRGCYSSNNHFDSSKPRYRYDESDFDLCYKCIVYFVDKKNDEDDLSF